MRAFIFSLLVFCLAEAADARLKDDCDFERSSISELSKLAPEILEITKSNPGALTRTAGIYGADDRVLADTAIHPFKSMGMLTSEFAEVEYKVLGVIPNTLPYSDANCTATLISSCHILTAKHCVEDLNRPEDFQKASRISFEDSRGGVSQVTKLITGKKSGVPSDDWAVLMLDRAPGKELGNVSVCKRSPRQIKDGTPLIAAGFSGDFEDGEKLSVDTKAISRRSKKAVSNVLFLATDSYFGASGGPIIAPTDEGENCLVGVQSETWVSEFYDEKRKPAQMYFSDDEKEKLGTAAASSGFFGPMVKFINENPCPEP